MNAAHAGRGSYATPLENPRASLRVREQNDPEQPMCTICQSMNPNRDRFDYHEAPFPSLFSGDRIAANLPTFTVDQVADQLKSGFFKSREASWDVEPGGEAIDVDISRLTEKGQFYAELALDAWTMTTGIEFNITELEIFAFGFTRSGIIFDDTDSGAYAQPIVNSENEIYTARINISQDWIRNDGETIDNYSFQTFIHEIGHALGLEHAGNYNGNAKYSTDALYTNDSWQMSIMSYFSQTDNASIDASFAYVVTPMIADITAVQQLYGVAGDLRPGNTIYGQPTTQGGSLMSMADGYYEDFGDTSRPITYTIIDDGGFDAINFSDVTADQNINLNGGAVSDVNGLKGNLVIFSTTVIEYVVSGSGNDTLTGNGANNHFFAGDGRDTIFGGDGDDILEGQGGIDILTGGAGRDGFVLSGTGFDGLDIVTDFTDGEDLLFFAAADSFSDISVSERATGTVVGFNGEFAILLGVSSNQISADDFVFG
ncbi:M10 family metallopeptidase [Dinoroseobacter shibae]|jgi:serralysin|nr:M10 family metallopeptidase [Dinoroseobacter shibae]URF46549.1 M10 family metallopeptidase C-terminal domain-containing protein [Dinoroseobacter shibae]URF50855.1 M10 family metallopeptidase C-terminal domain-containing protein [Dinoroseobacter shibae]